MDMIEVRDKSKLTYLKEALNHQIIEMANQFPHRKVGIITFGETVRVIGDGSQETKHEFENEDLFIIQQMKNDARGLHDHYFQRDIGSSAKQLLKEVENLQTDGSTALGPGAFLSVAVASYAQPGS